VLHRKQRSRNPFYTLLVIVGTLFAVTAFAYGIMALVDVRASRQLADPGSHPLLDWLRQHGDLTMLAELGVLAVLTFAAMGTDGYWDRRPDEN
jgi:hypothetical protein